MNRVWNGIIILESPLHPAPVLPEDSWVLEISERYN